MKRFLSIILTLVCLALSASAQTTIANRAKFDKTVHDFGTITQKDGPQTCIYTVTNVGTEPLTILSVVASCGCTNVSWTRTSIKPGDSGEIKVTYENNYGPYPFDKTVTAYLSDIKKPVILHLKGVVTKK